MANNIVRAIEDGVEFFTVLETGESGMSVSGLARFCGVTPQAIAGLIRTVENPTSKKASKWLKGLHANTLTLQAEGKKKGGTAKILTVQTCSAIIRHYSFNGNETAQYASEKFQEIGITAFIQSITGWSQQTANVTRMLTGCVVIAPKQWEMHFNAEWRAEAERLTGHRWEWTIMSRFINQAVYNWFPAEVRAELDRVNPAIAGYRKNKQHQHFSEEASPLLRSHIDESLTLMRASSTIPEFEELARRRWHGRYQLSLTMH